MQVDTVKKLRFLIFCACHLVIEYRGILTRYAFSRHFLQAVTVSQLIQLAIATQDPFYTTDYIDRHIATFLASPQPGTSSCNTACYLLSSVVPGRVSGPGNPVYHAEQIYWSTQQAITEPRCRVSPQTAEEVSRTLRLLTKLQCQFAVKSGGHAAFKGASNIESGVTIDLADMNNINVSKDRTLTSLGPGNRWIDVYSTLDAMGLTVVGGRVADIGVGGLTLGGGISYFSGRYGWACDNVVNYQVVLANGSICDVRYETHPDLYFALRGGGNNFGIVTQFDVATFPQGDMWGGGLTFRLDSSPSLVDALVDFTTNAPKDPYAAVLMAYYYSEPYDAFMISLGVAYGKPEVNPRIFHNFTTLSSIGSSFQITNMTQMAAIAKDSNPIGFRQTSWTLTFQNDASLISKIVEIFKEEVNPFKGLSRPSLLLQPISLNMISHFSRNGGNALGMTDENGPLILLDVSIMWNSANDDKRILKAARNIINRGNATAYSMGLGHRFLYQNYAAAGQDVFQSYGADSHAKLNAVSAKYDPDGVFTKLQPGYFKL